MKSRYINSDIVGSREISKNGNNYLVYNLGNTAITYNEKAKRWQYVNLETNKFSHFAKKEYAEEILYSIENLKNREAEKEGLLSRIGRYAKPLALAAGIALAMIPNYSCHNPTERNAQNSAQISYSQAETNAHSYSQAETNAHSYSQAETNITTKISQEKKEIQLKINSSDKIQENRVAPDLSQYTFKLTPKPIITSSASQNFMPKNESAKPAENRNMYVTGNGKKQSEYLFDKKNEIYVLRNSPMGKAIYRELNGTKASQKELNEILDERSERLAKSREEQYAKGYLNPINPIINYVNAAERNNPKTAKASLKAAGKSGENTIKDLSRLGTASYFPRDHSVTDNDFKFKVGWNSLEDSVRREWSNLKAANIPKNEDLLISVPLIYSTQSFYNGPLQIAHDSANLTTVVDNFSKPAEGVLNNSLDTIKHVTHIVPNLINEQKLAPGIKQFVHATTSLFKGITHFGSRVLSNRPHKAMDEPEKAAINAGSAAGRNAENLFGFFIKALSLSEMIKGKTDKSSGKVEWDSDGSPGGNGSSFGSGGSVGGN